MAANKYLGIAANRGVADAQFELGLLYFNGLGVKRDFIEAYKWFSFAAASGNEQAKQSLRSTGRFLTPMQQASVWKWEIGEFEGLEAP